MRRVGTNVTKAGRSERSRLHVPRVGAAPETLPGREVKARGITVSNFQDGIEIQAKGGYDPRSQNLGSSTKRQVMYTTNSARLVPRTAAEWDHNNLTKITSNPKSLAYLNAAWLDGDGQNGGGPIWAIFDGAAKTRRNFNVAPPIVDPAGFFFQAHTLEELAGKINVMPHQRIPVSPADLVDTVARYNSFVEGADLDFGKPTPQFRIQTPPFYAAWATPTLHDARSGPAHQWQTRGPRLVR